MGSNVKSSSLPPTARAGTSHRTKPSWPKCIKSCKRIEPEGCQETHQMLPLPDHFRHQQSIMRQAEHSVTTSIHLVHLVQVLRVLSQHQQLVQILRQIYMVQVQ